MAPPMRTNRDASHDLAVIGVRVLDHAHMSWVAAEIESERALHAWFKQPGRTAPRPTSHTAQQSTANRRPPATCSGSPSSRSHTKNVSRETQ